MSSTRALRTPGKTLCIPFLSLFLRVGIKHRMCTIGSMNILRKEHRVSLQRINSLILWPCHCLLWCTQSMWTISCAYRSRRVLPGTRPIVFLMRWSRPDCLFTQHAPGCETQKAGSSIRRGRLSECLAGAFGAFVLPFFMSHLGVGRTRTKSVLWLVPSRSDVAHGCPSFRNFGWSEFDLSGSVCPKVSIVVRCFSMGVVR